VAKSLWALQTWVRSKAWTCHTTSWLDRFHCS
jgi:hypothetical protein